MKTEWVLLTVLGLLMVSFPLSGGEPGSAGAAFLKLGVDGRAIGMGEAQAGLVDNVNALYWNPAGIARIGGPQLAFMHNFHFLEMHHDYLGIASPLGYGGSVGLAAYYWTSGAIMGMDEKALPTEEFSAWDLAFGLYYAHELSRLLSLGGGLKAVIERNEKEGGSALATDIGVLFNTPLTGLSLGITARNLGTRLKLMEESYSLPLALKLGAAWKAPSTGLALATDLTIPNDDQPSLSAGIEYSIVPLFTVRAGYKTGSDLGTLAGLRAGCGFSFQKITLDYAFAPYGDLGNSHRVSLLLKM